MTGSSTAPGGRASSASGSTARSYDIADAPKLDKYKRHSIEVVVDRYIVRHAEAPEGAQRGAGRPADRPGDRRRSSRTRTPAGSPTRSRPRCASARASSSSRPAPRDGEAPAFEERRYSEKYSCPYDGFTVDELEPRSFSFNSPHGACPACTGLGTQAGDRPGPRHPGPLEEPRPRARSCRGRRMPTDASWRLKILEAICAAHGWDFKAPVRDLPARGARLPALREEGREGRRPLPPRARREHLQGDLRGRRHQPRAPLPRDRLGVHQDRAREVHGHPAVPDLRRQAAAARDPGGHDRRPERLGRLDAVDHGRAALGDRPRRRR